jgi:hypothetical protein
MPLLLYEWCVILDRAGRNHLMLSPLLFVWSCAMTFQCAPHHIRKKPQACQKQKQAKEEKETYQYKASVLWLMQAMQPLSRKFLATEASRA